MILITGIAGFIGSHLAENLDYEIIGIDNFNDYYDPSIKRDNVREILSKKKNVIIEEGDIRDKNFLNKIFDKYKIEIVVHLAAMAGVRPSLKKPELYEDVNIKGTMNLLEIMAKKNIKKYIFASSSSVYGNIKEVPFSEDMKIDTPISFYAATKKACEEINHVYHSIYDIDTINLRFFTVYGPRQRPDLAIHKFTKLIYENKPIEVYGDGKQKRDFTYIDDILDGIKKSIQYLNNNKKVFLTLNLGESRTVELSYVISLIEKNLSKKADIIYKDPEPGDLPITFADISKAKKIIGYSPQKEIEDGIKEFINWFIVKNK
ncbi:MAG TPA: GDP-mannose 4,6-dehydratase [Spirochaetota bacterium]|nr:GDP-mannose 4,6-dehydratase [Spirochaetota bacterium]HOM38587.1 GDP-mannose 4,6-dehydratase [Spirochaetota bacterium]HPQ49724.1 GDP-mannose 4,6-dehydratase [Spirochaetota bacterium]